MWRRENSSLAVVLVGVGRRPDVMPAGYVRDFPSRCGEILEEFRGASPSRFSAYISSRPADGRYYSAFSAVVEKDGHRMLASRSASPAATALVRNPGPARSAAVETVREAGTTYHRSARWSSPSM